MKWLSNRLLLILGFLKRAAYSDIDLILKAIDCFGLKEPLLFREKLSAVIFLIHWNDFLGLGAVGIRFLILSYPGLLLIVLDSLSVVSLDSFQHDH